MTDTVAFRVPSFHLLAPKRILMIILQQAMWLGVVGIPLYAGYIWWSESSILLQQSILLATGWSSLVAVTFICHKGFRLSSREVNSAVKSGDYQGLQNTLVYSYATKPVLGPLRLARNGRHQYEQMVSRVLRAEVEDALDRARHRATLELDTHARATAQRGGSDALQALCTAYCYGASEQELHQPLSGILEQRVQVFLRHANQALNMAYELEALRQVTDSELWPSVEATVRDMVPIGDYLYVADGQLEPRPSDFESVRQYAEIAALGYQLAHEHECERRKLLDGKSPIEVLDALAARFALSQPSQYPERYRLM